MREALALHFLDDFDSKMASMRATLESESATPNEDVWTERNPSLRRALLRAEKYLGSAEGEPGSAAANSTDKRATAAAAPKTPSTHR